MATEATRRIPRLPAFGCDGRYLVITDMANGYYATHAYVDVDGTLVGSARASQ
jgi:hypothetical protein